MFVNVFPYLQFLFIQLNCLLIWKYFIQGSSPECCADPAGLESSAVGTPVPPPGPRYKLATEGSLRVCCFQHTRTVVDKILAAKFLRRWETHVLCLQESHIVSKTVRLIRKDSSMNKIIVRTPVWIVKDSLRSKNRFRVHFGTSRRAGPDLSLMLVNEGLPSFPLLPLLQKYTLLLIRYNYRVYFCNIYYVRYVHWAGIK